MSIAEADFLSTAAADDLGEGSPSVPSRHGPLRGLQVLDLTQLLPGPLATRHLVRWGASVIKIEPPGAGDGTRHMLRAADEGSEGLFFNELNDGKDGLRLNLRDGTDRARFMETVRTADAVVEGFRPGVMDRLGLGWKDLKAVNPRLVMCAITGYGQRSAYALKAGHDINYIALAGVLGQIGSASSSDPVVPNFQIADLLGGTLAAVSGLLAALLGAQRSGRGCYVDISMTHEVWRHAVIARHEARALGVVPAKGHSLLNGGAPCYGVYRCADGRHLAVGALELKFWQALCGALGKPDWGLRHWSLGEPPGSTAAREMQRLLAAELATRSRAEWMATLDPADCCVTPVLSLDEVDGHPWRQAARR